MHDAGIVAVTNTDGSYDTNNAKLLFASLPVFQGTWPTI